MAFIDQQDIFNATSGGLDIIYLSYPQAKAAQSKADKRFKVRTDEQTPSASLKQLADGIWVVTDFGGDQVPRNGIQVYMKEENLSFREALVQLGGIYGVGSIKAEINKPGFEKRLATSEEKENEYIFNIKEEITEGELKVLGPKVTLEVCRQYNVYSLHSFTYIKNREALVTSSSENYPIFLFDHGDFKKLYQPLNPEKQYRFRYTGNKPKDYVNGLLQLNKAYEKYRDNQLKSQTEDNESQEIKKLDEAIICSGERDALNVAGYGYYPIWFNSETADLTGKHYKDITRCVNTLYNLPDIDATGIRAAIKLGMKYLDIHHIWLPESLQNFKDPRGKSRKDFLDYIEIYPKAWDFKKLINVAKPMQFWRTDITKTGIKYNISSANTRFFLQGNGFYQLENKNVKTGQMFVKIDGHIVSEVQSKDIKGYLIKYCENNYLNNEVLELVLNTNRLSEATLQGLKQIDIDFTDYEPNSQYLFFRNKVWNVTQDQVIESRPGDLNRYVWEEEVIDHNVKKLNDFFKITENKNLETYDIEILNTHSKYFSFLINSSRIYWRKELEKELDVLPENEQEEYIKNNRFTIDGKLLSEEEICEQKLHLVNKIFSIGYLLHRYKTQSKAWAVFAMDNIIGEEGESNGRSGKSFAYKALRHFMKSVTLSGRNPKLTDNPHLYDRVTEHTDYVLVDDADIYLNYKFFFDSITGELIVNPKNNQSYEIPFEKSPKYCFTSNHALRNMDTSLIARILYTVFSDYYHEKTENNDYRETRKIRDDFGKDLFGFDYSEEEWNADFNFFAQCIKFYLSVPSPRKINPPMGNVTLRNLLAEMTQPFKDWADAYFDTEGGSIDALVAKDEALTDFMQKTNTKGWTTNKFTKALRAFTRFYGYEYNPKAFQNNQGRISKKVDGTTKDMIYIKTKLAVNPEELHDGNTVSNSEDDKPF
jgi:DNA primase